jgi:predicted outer membrane repeat protein
VQGFTFRDHDGLLSPIMIFESGGVIADCVFEDNSNHGSWGGAISVSENPFAPAPPRTVRIERCVFRRNVHPPVGYGLGGALLLSSGDQANLRVVVANSLFEENEGKIGGAIYADEVDLDIRNSQFHANRASKTASALYWKLGFDFDPVPARHVSILGSTFHGNVCTAPDAPAVLIAGDGVPAATMSAENSIFWGNANPGTLQHQVLTTTHVAADAAWCTLQSGPAGWSGPVTFGPGISAADPLFVNPAVGDLHLGPGSPCRDAGDPAFVALPGELDLDGQPRVFGPVVDQGADEDQP